MTTIIEKAKRIGILSTQVLANDRWRQQAAVWDQNQANIKSLARQLTETLDFLKWIGDKGTDFVPSSPSGVGQAKNAIERYLTYISNDPDVDKAVEQSSKLSKSIEVVVESQKQSARALWTSYCVSIAWENPDIYAAFKNDDTYGERVRNLTDATRVYQGFVGEEFLKREEQRVAFDALLATHAELIGSLPPMDDEEVKAFLVEAATVGAPLGRLTANVVKWLKDHRLTAKYSVRRRDT